LDPKPLFLEKDPVGDSDDYGLRLADLIAPGSYGTRVLEDKKKMQR
jgi:hypothetical protein